MDDKKILNEIKKEINENIPNILHKIDLQSIEIEPAQKINKSKKSIFNLFTVLVPLTTIILIVSLTLILNQNTNPLIPTNYEVSSKDKIVANYATSAMNIIEIESNSSFTNVSMTTKERETIDSFHQYSNSLQEYLKLTTNVVEIKSNDSKQYKYDLDMTITNIDFFGNTKKYQIFYNQKSKTDDEEVESNMDGIIVIENIVYNFQAELESENNEEEIEVTITNDLGLKIEIQKEVETKEYEINYKISNKNTLIKEISFEVDSNEIELEIIEFENNNKIINKFELIMNSNTSFLIKSDLDEDILLTIDLINKSFIYTINGNSITKKN